ncbi:MAG TPA: SURF1 family protein [Candidatus Elarobacter sp.]|nr:SURF1 family protein [Candidatus Elarobacter sp.]
MSVRPRDLALIVITTLFSATCISLGFWQLRRLAERRAVNATVVHRLAEPPVTVTTLPRDSAALHYRRVIVDGVYDYAHEVRIIARTRNGSPGVNIVTPVRMAGNDTALLVNRGWVYSPDASTVDLARWRESDSARGIGYARPLERRPLPGSPALADRPGAYRWLDTVALRASIPYQVYPFSVVLEGDTAPRGPIPPRVPPPPLDEGPHMSYAIQWFSFAAIAIIGTFFFLRVVPAKRRATLEPFERDA